MVERLRVESQSEEIQEHCSTILSEMDESTGAIAAAGLFHINLGYLVEKVSMVQV